MARKIDLTDFGITDDTQRGYEAAKAGKAHYRHDRWWIDDNGAELARREVVKGIEAYYQDADAADLADTQECAR